MKAEEFVRELEAVVQSPGRWSKVGFGSKVSADDMDVLEGEIGAKVPGFYHDLLTQWGPYQMIECDDEEYSDLGADFRLLPPPEALAITKREREGWKTSDAERTKILLEDALVFQKGLQHDKSFCFILSKGGIAVLDSSSSAEGMGKQLLKADHYFQSILGTIKNYQTKG